MGWWTDPSDRQHPASSSISQTTAQPLCTQGFKWGHRVLVAAPIQQLQPSFPPFSLPDEGETHFVKLVGQNKKKGSKNNTLLWKSLRNTLKAEIGFCSSQGCPWIQRPLVK